MQAEYCICGTAHHTVLLDHVQAELLLGHKHLQQYQGMGPQQLAAGRHRAGAGRYWEKAGKWLRRVGSAGTQQDAVSRQQYACSAQDSRCCSARRCEGGAAPCLVCVWQYLGCKALDPLVECGGKEEDLQQERGGVGGRRCEERGVSVGTWQLWWRERRLWWHTIKPQKQSWWQRAEHAGRHSCEHGQARYTAERELRGLTAQPSPALPPLPGCCTTDVAAHLYCRVGRTQLLDHSHCVVSKAVLLQEGCRSV